MVLSGNNVWHNLRKIFSGKVIFFFLLCAFLMFYIKPVILIVMIFFVILNAVFTAFVDRYFELKANIELLTFSVVLCTLAYGYKNGFFVAIVGMMGQAASHKKIKAYEIFSIAMYLIDVLIANLFGHIMFLNIYLIGGIVVIFNLLYGCFIERCIVNRYPIEIFYLKFLNVVTNFLLFSLFARPILNVLESI